MHFLIAESETAEQRARRRADVNTSAGESLGETLRTLVDDLRITLVAPADADAELMSPDELARFDAVFVGGSPLHVYEDSPEARRQLAFMRQVFASGTPSFGSCAGLQLAVAAAGGVVGPMAGKEAGLARRIARTADGQDHPLLAGRGVAWDAPAVHGDEVKALPEGAVCLATNAVTAIQAVELRSGAGTFWGVQYHPELSVGEIAAALRRQKADLVANGLALTEAAVEDQATLLDALHQRPDRLDLRWRLGVDDEVADRGKRTLELANFIRHLAVPTRAKRGLAVAA
jgi:GMP synthase-like glutamine amidotransferase